jgi:PHP family Zn ribbon phosphoesterase
VSSKKVVAQYNALLESLGSEFEILLKIPVEKIAKASTLEIARAVERMRDGNITITPGYDGVFGKVHVFTDNEQRRNHQETLEL